MNGTMDSNQPTIWMNVTTSANWNRPAVGIVRVEQELHRELSVIFNGRFRSCVLKDGQFLEYSKNNSNKESWDDTSNQTGIFWPDPSFDFPSSSSLELGLNGGIPVKRNSPYLPIDNPILTNSSIKYGDILISVGLDWNWETDRIDKVFYNLKKKHGVSIICCCYDLIPILFPQYCVGDVAAKFKEYFTNITWAASAMLCISRRTEQDYHKLVNDLGLPEVPTLVMPLGNNLPEAGAEISDKIQEIIQKSYILFVSTIERRKNHEIIYRAYHLLCRNGYAALLPKLVFVGMPGWGVGDFLKDVELDPLTKELIIQLHHVNDAELRLLYENSAFFVYPSLYEGWGLPVAEALAFGKVVIASDRGSIPEVGGDLVQYVDPWSAEAWAQAILALVENTDELRRREKNIRDNYQPTEWRKTAEVVKGMIDQLSANPAMSVNISPGYDLSTQVGLRFGSKLVSTGKPGVLCHGPYRGLPVGRISVIVKLDYLSNCSGKITWSLSSNKGKDVLASKETIFDGEAKFGIIVDFIDVAIKEAVSDFEIVAIISNDMLISINEIEISLNGDQ